MKNKKILMICFAALCFRSINGVDFNEFGAEIGKKIPTSLQQYRIVIAGFQSPKTEKAKSMARDLHAQLTAYLSRNGHQIVEREDISAILRESEFTQKGLIKGTHRDFFNGTQTDYLITGNLHKTGDDSYSVGIKIIDVRTWLVVFADQIELSQKKNIPTHDGIHTHDGFYYSVNAGFAYQTTAIAGYTGFDSLGINGSATLISSKMGWSLDESWVLSLNVHTLLFGTFGTPRIYSEPDIVTSRLDKSKELTVTLVGPGVTYYTPENYFATATIAPASVLYRDKQGATNIDSGFGLSLGLGREWWISNNWGIGFLVQATYSRVELEDIDVVISTSRGPYSDNNFVISTWSLSFAVTATYN